MPDTLPPADFTREDFEAWAQNPVTQWFSRSCMIESKALQDQWLDASWVGGKADQEALVRMRAQAGTLEMMADPNYDSVCNVLEMEPRG